MSTEFIKKSDDAFYSDGANYWSEIPATVDGMLGGFGFISEKDIKASKMLLKQLFNSKTPPGRKHALDCGAGIGRITKFLLTDMFEKVDLVEQNPIFLQQARKYMGPKVSKIGNLYSVGLQHFQPEAGKYDTIWIQWVLGHLTDSDLVKFFISCRSGLSPNGIIVVKENVTSSDDIELDRLDSSVTRPMRLLHRIFDNAGLDCYRQAKQHNFPKGLYNVYMFVLKPKHNDDCPVSNVNKNDGNDTFVPCGLENIKTDHESQNETIESLQETLNNDEQRCKEDEVIRKMWENTEGHTHSKD